MAATESIHRARQDLEHRLLDLMNIIKMADDLASDYETRPNWLNVFYSRALDIDRSAHAYMDTVHEHAYPVLRDMESISRST